MCSQCPERTSRAENRDWDSCTVASFKGTHSAVCSLKNSPRTEASPFGNTAIILKGHLCLTLPLSLSSSLSCSLSVFLSLVHSYFLPSLLEQGVRPLGNSGDIFKGPSVAERTALPKPRGSTRRISGHKSTEGMEGFKWGTNMSVFCGRATQRICVCVCVWLGSIE